MLDVTITFPDSGATGFLVSHYVLTDALHEVFELTLDVLSQDPDIDLSTLMGEAITVAFNDEPFLKQIKGIVRRVRQLSALPTGNSTYEIVVVPPLWLATRRKDNRIFQNVSADEICEQAVTVYGSRVPAPSKVVSPGKPKSEYRVQYGETDLDFMLRVLAEEGMVSFFDHGVGSAWTIADDISHVFNDSGQPVPFIPPVGAGMTTAGPQVSVIAVTSDLDTSSSTVRDYDFLKPELVLEKKTKTKQTPWTREADLESYEFLSGKFTAATEKQGDTLAQQFLDEARSDRRVLECQTSFALGAGGHFTVSGHPRSDVNVELCVVRARCEVTAQTTGSPKRQNVLTCTPADDAWRAERLPKPRIYGTHIAFVVGTQAGVDEIDVDQYGRVKVEFRWDRRDQHEGNPTRWVRVSQGWAGLDYGMVLLPRVSEEVIVAYLDGDPDEPVIVGRLHNAFNVSPLKLPDEKTKSIWKSKTSPGGGGYNMVMMEDKKGNELLHLHAHKDNLITVEASQTDTVGGDQTIDVTGKRKDHVKGVVNELYDTQLTTIVSGPQYTNATDVKEVYKTLDTGITGTKKMQAGATTETYASLDTTVTGLHKEKYGTMTLDGGQLTWTLTAPGTINAPHFTINAPEFQTTHGGSHQDSKSFWQTIVAAWNDTTSHKASIITTNTTIAAIDTKIFGLTSSVGGVNFGTCAMKVDFAGFSLKNSAVNIKGIGAKVHKEGIRAVLAGIFSIA